MTSALDVEETAGALDKYRRRAGGLILAGVVTLALAVGFWALLVDTVSSRTAAMPFVPGILLLGGGTGMWGLAWRMRRALGAGTWSVHPAVAIGHGRTATTVVLRSPDRSEAWPLTVIATRQRYELVRPGPDGVLWWCGDPRVGGVLAPPGGGELIWAKPVRGGHVRRRVVARAEAEGLMHRATPRQPGNRVPGPVPGPDQATDVDSVRGPEGVKGPEDVRGPEDVQGPEAVRGPEDVQGPEAVQDVARTEPSGPTYAELFEHARRQAGPRGGRAPRPERDAREVAWWRVRSLRRVAGVHRVVIALGFCAAVGAVALTGPPKEDALKLGAVGVLVLGALAYSCHRLLTVGRPAARAMVRALTGTVHVRRRYTLLYDPRGGAPVLVLFPMYDGWDAGPEAVLRLIPPGPPKQPRRGLPAKPAGTVELHGWRDFTVDGRPFVVAWIDGRPHWPAGPYQEADGPEFAALVDRLAPPLEAQAS
ncbi:hypothetical protein STANM337S_03229 [Streptomyces tanashiensis]